LAIVLSVLQSSDYLFGIFLLLAIVLSVLQSSDYLFGILRGNQKIEGQTTQWPKVGRYQRGNQKIEGQTTQWPKVERYQRGNQKIEGVTFKKTYKFNTYFYVTTFIYHFLSG
jgi:hypothetical protein